MLLLTKTFIGHQRGGSRAFGPKTAFLGKIFSLKIGLLLRKYFRKQINMQLESEMKNWKWSNKTFHRPCLYLALSESKQTVKISLHYGKMSSFLSMTMLSVFSQNTPMESIRTVYLFYQKWYINGHKRIMGLP